MESIEVRLPVRAGLRRVSATFFKITSALFDGVIQEYAKPQPHSQLKSFVRKIAITGPFEPVVDDTPSRRRIFTCRPSGAQDELRCAREIMSTLARRAYRRPVTAGDVGELMTFYEVGLEEQGFEGGITRAIERLLVSPSFLFRVATDPAEVTPGAPYRISDLELASRLSFFLWSSIPDDELLRVAADGRLRDPVVLEQQVTRMLASPKSDVLVKNFTGQWLQLRNLEASSPNQVVFPYFTDNLRQSFRRETEHVFEHVLRAGRSVLDLLNADYTFINGQLARHYGIPNVYGSRFRRVTLTDEARHGLLGHGSVLTVTSYAMRTSPVIRGKWVLDNLLGASPPPPPPDVPTLQEKTAAGEALSMREAMTMHRASPGCASCHAQMDPIGFALENFDGVGRWRTMSEANTPIDASGRLPNGTTFEGVNGLRQVLLSQPERFVSTVTEKLLIYALGRGVEYYDMPAVRTIVREAAPSDYALSSLVLGGHQECTVSDEEGGVMIVTRKALSRRTVLRSIGATVALPLLDSMIPAFTPLAVSAASPVKRLGFVHVPMGANMPVWKRSKAMVPASSCRRSWSRLPRSSATCRCSAALTITRRPRLAMVRATTRAPRPPG